MNDRLKLVRAAEKMNQAEFSKALGIGQSTLAMMEVGKREITDRHIKAICAIFHVNEEWFRNGTGVMFIEDDSTVLAQLVKQYGLDDFSRRFIETFIKLPAPQRNVIKEFAYSLVGASETDCPADCDAFSEFDIDAEVDSYRRELEQEKRVAEKSPASGGIKEA